MGRFNVGDRVVDGDGDETTVLEKRKGYLKVEYKYGGPLWLTTDFFTPADDGKGWPVGSVGRDWDNRQGTVAKIGWGQRKLAYDDGGKGWVPVESLAGAWVPKVGDRVRLTRDKSGGPAGSEGVIESDEGGGAYRVLFDAPFDGWGATGRNWIVYYTNLEPLPVAQQPAGESGGGFKAGDRIRLIDSALPDMPLGSEFVAVKRTSGNASSVHFMRDGHVTWRPGSYFTLATTWAPVVGKYGMTRDGRKVGPIQNYADGYFHNGDGDNLLWTDDGKGVFNDDLIAEWPATSAPVAPVADVEATATKFKVGDRVVYEGSPYARPCYGTVSRIDGRMVHASDWTEGSGEGFFFDSNLRLATPTFSPGQLVTLATPLELTGTHHAMAHLRIGDNSYTLPIEALAAA